jgi:conjugal transfer mating pair stabilization protein TraG
MLEVFTIGGGEYIVNVLNAVAAWTGGGGFRSLIQVTMVIGLAYVLLVVAFSLNWRAWFTWFVSATLMYGALIVPTTSVKVTDRINPSLAPAVAANVPIGLAAIASFTSQIGDWLTGTAETVFAMPDALAYRTGGIIYGARLYDRTQDFRFRDPRVRANLTEYFRQCLFYDFLLGQKDPAEVMNSTDVLADMGPGSPARAMKYRNDDGSSQIKTCAATYSAFTDAAGLQAATDKELTRVSPSFFPDLTAAAAKSKLEADLPEVAARFHGGTQNAAQIFQQRALTEAFLEARANLSADDGDTFAMMRAETQAKNTYTTISQQAMTWVPLLNLVLVVVFYAMFPVIFPLFLIPQTGTGALKGYLTGFFYLAAWGPLYAVLHMFIMGREESAMAAAAPGGMTMATMASIDSVNADAATIAGFLMMSIPFLAGGLAKGAMTISSQATSMLAPAQAAAEAAATERTTGNYAYGNQSYQNLTGNVVQRDQWNTAPAFAGGFARSSFVNDNGTGYAVTADGTVIYDNRSGMSSLGFSAATSHSTMAEVSQAAAELEARRTQLTNSRSERVAALERMGFSEADGFRSAHGSEASSGHARSASQGRFYSKSEGVSEQIGSTSDIASSTNMTQSANEQYTSGTNTNWSLAASFSGSGKGSATTGGGKTARAGGLSANIGIDARESVNFADGVSMERSTRSASTSGDVHRQSEDSSEDYRQSDEAYRRGGDFSRSEGYAESRTFRDQTIEEIKSIDRQLSEIGEVSRSLGTTWTMRDGGGYQISQDLSQVVASRYQEYARSEDFRDLGAPSLQALDVSPTQSRARDLIVGHIAQDYVEEIMSAVRSEMISPSPTGKDMQEPDDSTELDLRSALGRHSASGPGESFESFQDIDDIIDHKIREGRKSIEDRHAGAQANRNSSVKGALGVDGKSSAYFGKEWFRDHDR